MATISNSNVLTPEEFVFKAIDKLRECPYKGIHSVYSGLDAAFKRHFPNLGLRDILNGLAEEGKITIRPAARGVMLYKGGEVSRTAFVEGALKKILKWSEPTQTLKTTSMLWGSLLCNTKIPQRADFVVPFSNYVFFLMRLLFYSRRDTTNCCVQWDIEEPIYDVPSKQPTQPNPVVYFSKRRCAGETYGIGMEQHDFRG